MRKIWFLAFSILVSVAACNDVHEPGPDLGTLACMHPGDCGSGKECCVTYSANGGGYATSQCVSTGMCPFFGFTDGSTSIACDTDSDCQQAGKDGDVDAGTRKLVCSPLFGVSNVKSCALQ